MRNQSARAAVLVSSLLFLSSFSLATAVGIQFPLSIGDYGAIWGVKARTLYASGDLVRVFQVDPAGEFSHPEYPLAWPLLMAGVSSLLGRYDEYLLAFLRPFLLLLSSLLLARQIRAPLAWRILGSAALCLLPYFLIPAFAGYAETLLLVFVLASLAVLDGGEDSWRAGSIAGLCLAMAAMTKNEGALVALVVAVALIFAGRRRTAVLAAGLPLLATLLWWVTRRPHLETRPLVDYSASAFSAGKLWLAGAEIIRLYFLPNLAWIAGSLALLVLSSEAARKRRGELLGAVGYLGLLFLSYGFTHHEPRWHVQNSWERLMLIPVACVLLPVLVEAAAKALEGLTRPVPDERPESGN